MKGIDKIKRALLVDSTDKTDKLIKTAYLMGQQSNRITSAATVVSQLRRNLDSLWSDDDKKSLDRVIQILNSEAEREVNDEAHSEVTLEYEYEENFE